MVVSEEEAEYQHGVVLSTVDPNVQLWQQQVARSPGHAAGARVPRWGWSVRCWKAVGEGRWMYVVQDLYPSGSSSWA